MTYLYYLNIKFKLLGGKGSYKLEVEGHQIEEEQKSRTELVGTLPIKQRRKWKSLEIFYTSKDVKKVDSNGHNFNLKMKTTKKFKKQIENMVASIPTALDTTT